MATMDPISEELKDLANKIRDMDFEVRAGRLFLALMKDGRTIIAHGGSKDVEDECSITMTDQRGKQRTATGADPVAALTAVLDLEPSKTCRKCKETKKPVHFSKDAGQPGGRNRFCRECEAKRVKAYEQKK